LDIHLVTNVQSWPIFWTFSYPPFSKLPRGFLAKAIYLLLGNAYLNAPCWEKIWCRAGKEFGSNKGCIMIIVQVLYGLKTSGTAWRAAFADKLAEMGYKSTKANPDVWI